MNEIDRRRFLGSAAGAAAVLGATGGLRAAAPPKKLATEEHTSDRPPRPPLTELGKTGIKMSRLGQGTGVHGGNRQSDQTRLGFAKLVDLMHHAYDRGIRFFDMADLYGTHIYFREALKAMDRSQLAILTKMWWRYDGPENQTSLPDRRQMARTTLDRFRDELTTYPDIVLLHCLTKPGWDQQMGPYMDVLHEAKAKNQIKAVGCSCHDLGAMKTAAACPWVDVMLARINMKCGAKFMTDGTREEVEDVLRTARANGKAIIGMKIFGEGRLADERDACMKYAQENGLLDAMTIGFHTPDQIDDVLRLMHKHPAKAVV
ncbi:MAG TPA: aldo/keto reductase [Lacipirellulaceae bacterium]|nr:aldo/keto reductase [Lacipirellulaceae bacterium]